MIYTKKELAVVIFTCAIAVALMVQITYLGVVENNPLQTWSFPVIVGICLIVWLIKKIADYRLTMWAKNHKALQETGVYDYLTSNTGLSLCERDGQYESVEDWFARALKYTSGKTFDTSGYVCGELVIGVVENMQLFVTVTKPETAKAFRSLPRTYRKIVHVIEAFD